MDEIIKMLEQCTANLKYATDKLEECTKLVNNY